MVWQENRSDWVLATIVSFGVDIRPEAMRIAWADVEATLREIDAWSVAHGYLYTIANAVPPPSDAWLEAARHELYAAYDEDRKE